MSSKTYLIIGTSKGLGQAISHLLPSKDDKIYGVSRSQNTSEEQPSNFHWIGADLSNPQTAIQQITASIQNQPIDYLIYNVGIWEHNAFSEDYSFDANTQQEILTMINTNISSCILLIQALLANLRQASNAKVILIGSTWGLDNHKGKEVTFSATKFALRGVVHALRENLREDKIGVSILNLGYLATEYGYQNSIAHIIEQSNGELIPLQDVVQAIRFILSTSTATCVKEINMPAMMDTNM